MLVVTRLGNPKCFQESHVSHMSYASKEPMELTNTCASWRKQRASKESRYVPVPVAQWPKVGWEIPAF